MKYVYTTIAIGEKYFTSACNFAKKLNEISKNHSVLIVTDCKPTTIEKTIFLKFDESQTKVIKNQFNYNLKYLPILESNKLDVDFILFFDADWVINEGYNETKLISFLNDLKSSNIDFVYERPHSIGDNKRDLNKCFWKHKLEPYGLLKTTLYDKSQVVNEQFMVFKKNEKLKIFIDKWKDRNEFGVKNNIWAFAEGVEIGMSSVDAKMNMDWKKMFELKNFFYFIASTGIKHNRF